MYGMTGQASIMAKRSKAFRHHCLSTLIDFIVVIVVAIILLQCCRARQIGERMLRYPFVCLMMMMMMIIIIVIIIIIMIIIITLMLMIMIVIITKQ